MFLNCDCCSTFCLIIVAVTSGVIVVNNSYYGKSITEKRLRKLTFALMKIVREVIMYLPLVVRVEEEQKNQIRKEPAMPFYLDLYEDKWKR